MKLSRRTLLAGSLAMPFADWVKRAEGAGSSFKRYAANTPQGKDMLKSYAVAVAKMKDPSTPQGSPLSWVFQWYSHCVPNNTGGPDDAAKNAAINKIYGGTPSANRSLAGEMWDTCQPHGGQNEDFFLPWHRMFVYFFERIVRKMSGNPQFALPYWDYTVAGVSHGVIPVEFQKPGALFVDNRNPNLNNGQAIDKGRRVQLNLDSLKQTAYQPTGGAVQGFCMNLDSNLHGQVHVYTGTTTNMGAVPYAAGDPVFWMHHCNIDRIWASWNKNGGKNPINDSDFMMQKFIFADESGSRVEAKVSDFLEIDPLGYSYDRLEPKPAGFIPQDLSVRTRLMSDLTKTPPPVITKPASVALGAKETIVALTPAPTAKASLKTTLQSVEGGKRLYLVVKDLHFSAQPGVVYDVYLEKTDSRPVGAINFFGAGHAAHDGMSSQKFWSVDVTDRAKSASARAKEADPLKVIIVPAGKPAEDAKPVIGSMSLVEL
jgi:tyrosinase